MAPLPPHDQRHLWLRYQIQGYTEEIVYDFERRLKTIFDRRLFGIRAPLVQEFILEFFSSYKIEDEIGLDVAGLHTAEEMAEDGFGAYWLGSERLNPDKGDLSYYWVEISSGRDFLRGAPSYTYIRDPVWRLCHRHAEGRKSGARLSGGYFIGHLAHHFGLVSDDGLRGLSVVAHELPLIDMGELVKLNICMEIGDEWAWVASGPKRQQVVASGSLEVVEDAPTVDEGAQADLAPIQEEIQGLRRDVRCLRRLVERSMTDQGRVSTWMISYMTQLMEASGKTYQAFDGTFRGSSPAIFERRTRRRTSETSTFAAPQQLDP
ncbi:hypothetical protein Tco_1556139 [Tanacetum coccineum]